MIAAIKERKAVYDIAKLVTEFNWVFREQPIMDFGIDAILETITNGRPSGRLFAAQIKGRTKKIRYQKSSFTLYFSDAHKDYWLSIGESMPVFMFFQDQSDDQVYWQLLSAENITKTAKHWKIHIPHYNKLNEHFREQIEDIVINYKRFLEWGSSVSEYEEFFDNGSEFESITVSFNVKSSEKDVLCCKMSDMHACEEIKLKYHYGLVLWDGKKKELSWEDAYHFTIYDLERYITLKYNTLKEDGAFDIIKPLKDEIEKWADEDGIDGVARKLFDKENLEHGIPEYDKFIEAFEYHSKLKKGQYWAQTVGSVIHFKTLKCEVYELDTYEGRTHELQSYIDRKSHDEIYTMTNESFWSWIYLDAGIEKEVFISQMLLEWENYWDKLYADVKQRVGSIDHLNKGKEKSWRQMQAFMEGYNDAGDIIKLAWHLDDMTLYPIAVVTMMNIFDPDICYSEYCELEFYNGEEWESICVNDTADEYPIFFIRPYGL